MIKPDGWHNPMVEVHPATETEPLTLECTVGEGYLKRVDMALQEHKGITLAELIEERPRDAYVELGGLFVSRFIDPESEGWGIGSPEMDGERAFAGLQRYVEERRAPDPDIDTIDVTISVWKRGGILNFMRGERRVPREALSFRVEPQSLAEL